MIFYFLSLVYLKNFFVVVMVTSHDAHSIHSYKFHPFSFLVSLTYCLFFPCFVSLSFSIPVVSIEKGMCWRRREETFSDVLICSSFCFCVLFRFLFSWMMNRAITVVHFDTLCLSKESVHVHFVHKNTVYPYILF